MDAPEDRDGGLLRRMCEKIASSVVPDMHPYTDIEFCPDGEEWHELNPDALSSD